MGKAEASAIVALPARTLGAAIARGELSAREATEAYLARIEAVDPRLHAYARVAGASALRRAETIDAAVADGKAVGPLAGVPMGLKDIFVTKDLQTTCGSRILDGWVPPYDSTAGARLTAAGSVLLGKLAMDEFAMGSSNENTPDEPVRNPWALEYVPGGSSGGAAAAVVANMAAFALGTDTGGSIRQPASLCNAVGLKPTYGRVSRHGMIAFASSFDQAGPMTRDVRDAAVVLQAIAGVDPADATSLDVPVPDYLAACERGIRGLRVGVHRQALELQGLEPRVRAVFEQGLRVLADQGAELVDVDLPHFRYGIAAYYVLGPAEASSNLARYDGVRYGARVAGNTLEETYENTRAVGFGPEVKRRIMLGTFVLRKDSYKAYYGQAQRVRSLVVRDYEQAFQTCDVIASPTSPVAGFRRGERVDDPLAMYLADVFTVGANLVGLPGISIPAGFTDDDGPALPVGLQLVAPRFCEPRLLAAAAAHEDVTDWHRRAPAEVEP